MALLIHTKSVYMQRKAVLCHWLGNMPILLQLSPFHNPTPFALAKVASLEDDNFVVFNYDLSTASEIWLDKRGDLWWEGPHKRGDLW